MSHRQEIKKKNFFIYFYGMVGHSNEILYIKGNFTIFLKYLFNRKMKKIYINGKIRSLYKYDDTD